MTNFRGPAKGTQFLIICWLIDAKDHHLTLKEMERLAKEETGISYDALFTPLKKLHKLEYPLIEKGVGYSLPDDWRSAEYLIKMTEYFRIYDFEDKLRIRFVKFLETKVYPLPLEFIDYSNKKLLEKHEKKLARRNIGPHKRNELEVYMHIAGIEGRLEGVHELETIHHLMEMIAEDLSNIHTLDDLNNYQNRLRVESEKPTFDTALPSIQKDVSEIRRLIEDPKTPKKLIHLCHYFRFKVAEKIRLEEWKKDERDRKEKSKKKK